MRGLVSGFWFRVSGLAVVGVPAAVFVLFRGFGFWVSGFGCSVCETLAGVLVWKEGW